MTRALLTMLLLAGCADDQYLVVTVDARPAVHDAAQLVVTLSNGGTSRMDTLPLGGHAFPVTFSVTAPGRTGDLAISVEAQTADPRSTLRLYQDALRLRKELPALGDGTLRWLDGPDDVLAFEREPGFVCAVNFGTRPVLADTYGTLLLSSGRVNGGVLDPDTAAWWVRA